MKRKIFVRLTPIWLFMVLAPLFFANYIYAQKKGDNIVIGEIVTIQSKVLDEERELLIYKPVGYDQSQEKYPVLYLLDAHLKFHFCTGIVWSLRRYGRIPKMLVVGILNTDRNRDFTPTKVLNPTEGGADNFIEFMKYELIPYIDKNYRTQPFRILYGSSLCGMFTIYTLLTAPDTFMAYIASSPSLWWEEGSLLQRDINLLPETSVFIAVGKEGEVMEDAARELNTRLVDVAVNGNQVDFLYFGDQDHANILHMAVYYGIQSFYPKAVE